MNENEMNPALPMIHSCMESCMKKIGAITKDSKMDAQSKGQKIQYVYRSVDAVYNALQPAMIEAGITVVPQVMEYNRIPKDPNSGNYMNTAILKMAFRWTAADGSYVETIVVNEGQDSGDKAFSKAMANCFKYACFMAFVIPTQEMDTFDPDHYRPEIENDALAESAQKKTLKEKLADKRKEEQQKSPEQPKKSDFDKTSCINMAASKVGYPQGLRTKEEKIEFGCMVAEAIKAGKAVDKKTGEMSPEELQQCMKAVVDMFGKADA